MKRTKKIMVVRIRRRKWPVKCRRRLSRAVYARVNKCFVKPNASVSSTTHYFTVLFVYLPSAVTPPPRLARPLPVHSRNVNVKRKKRKVYLHGPRETEREVRKKSRVDDVSCLIIYEIRIALTGSLYDTKTYWPVSESLASIILSISERRLTARK